MSAGVNAAAAAARPDGGGRFGRFGGQFVPEALRPALAELTAAYRAARDDPAFRAELVAALASYSGRPTPLDHAARLSARVGATVLLKREDLNHTGAHKLNNTLGQILLALRMGKRRVIAETGAGQHGVATAAVAARYGLACEVFMGEEDIRRQGLNVRRMELMGARVRPVSSGTRTLKDATNEAIRDWIATSADTHYLIGSVVGPHPYPWLVRDFQSVIGEETRAQCRARGGRAPDLLVACVGGGSNAIGLFHPFLDDPAVRLVGVEAAGEGLASGRHAATLTAGSPGVLHGCLTYLLQDADGQVAPAHSVSAGLDYPGVGPEHAWCRESGRVVYEAVTDEEALDAFARLSELEGIIPALESAHAVAYLERLRGRLDPDTVIVVCLSGRGDKDLEEYLLRRGGRGAS